MKGLSALAAIAAIGAGMAASNPSQYTAWSQPPKGPRTKPGNSLKKGRKKAKARRKAKQQARRSA